MEKLSTKVCAIVAMSENRVIGKDNSIPWKAAGEQKRFRELTEGHPVLMGRKTYQSLPPRAQPLPGRLNIVVSREGAGAMLAPGVLCVTALEPLMECIRQGALSFGSRVIWIIGGEQVFRETASYWDEVFLTRIKGEYSGDTFLPPFEAEFHRAEHEELEDRVYERYIRTRP